MLRASPETRSRLPDRLGEPARARGAARGRRGRVPARRTRVSTRSSPRSTTAAGREPREADRREHRDRRSTRRRTSPRRPSAFPNWRIVPLYVRFGDESFRDYVELDPAAFYERLRRRRRAADDLAADARATSSPPTRSSRGYERILSLHISGKLSGTVESARTAARRSAASACASIDSGTRVGGDRDARARDPAAARARARPTRRWTRSSSATGATRACSSRSTRSSTSPAAAAIGRARALGGRAPPHQADPRRSRTARCCR